MPLIEPVIATATITNGTSLSTAVFVGCGELVGIEIPTGWTAAGLSFQASMDGTTFRDVYTEANAEMTVPTDVASKMITAPDGLDGFPWIKIRSGTAAAPVNQAAQRTINVCIKTTS